MLLRALTGAKVTSTETPHLIHPGAVNGARDCIAAIMVSTDAIDHVVVGIEAGVLEINFDGICCEPSATLKSQEQNVTNERNEDEEAGTNLTGLIPYYLPSLLTGSRLLPIQLIDKARPLNLVDEAQIPIVFLR